MDYSEIIPKQNNNVFYGNPFSSAPEVWDMILRYDKNPDAFSPEQVRKIKEAADQFMLPMDIKGSAKRAAKNFLYELGEGVTLGLLPDEWKPDTLTDGEELAGTAGSIASFLTPIGPVKYGASAAKGIMNFAKGAKGVGFAAKAGEMTAKAAEKGGVIGGIANMFKGSGSGISKALAGIPNEVKEKILAGALTGGGYRIFDQGIDPTGALVGGAIGGLGNWKKIGENVKQGFTEANAIDDAVNVASKKVTPEHLKALKEAGDLRSRGLITEKEYNEAAKNILANEGVNPNVADDAILTERKIKTQNATQKAKDSIFDKLNPKEVKFIDNLAKDYVNKGINVKGYDMKLIDRIKQDVKKYGKSEEQANNLINAFARKIELLLS